MGVVRILLAGEGERFVVLRLGLGLRGTAEPGDAGLPLWPEAVAEAAVGGLGMASSEERKRESACRDGGVTAQLEVKWLSGWAGDFSWFEEFLKSFLTFVMFYFPWLSRGGRCAHLAGQKPSAYDCDCAYWPKGGAVNAYASENQTCARAVDAQAEWAARWARPIFSS